MRKTFPFVGLGWIILAIAAAPDMFFEVGTFEYLFTLLLFGFFTVWAIVFMITLIGKR